MTEQRHGRIVANTYRAAVVGFVKALAAEVAENGITISIVREQGHQQ